MAALKGQNFRIFIGASVVAYATNCTVTLQTNTADESTKSDGMGQKPAVVTKSWQIQLDALDISDVTTFLGYVKAGTKLSVKWDETAASGTNSTGQNAAYGRSGYAFMTDATFNFNNREIVARNVTMTGTGGLTAINNT